MRVMQRRAFLMFLEMKSGRLARGVANAMFAVAGTVRLGTVGLKRLMRRRSAGGNLEREWQTSLAALLFHLVGRVP